MASFHQADLLRAPHVARLAAPGSAPGAAGRPKRPGTWCSRAAPQWSRPASGGLTGTGCDNWPYLNIFEQIPMDSNIKKQPNGTQMDSVVFGMFWMFLTQFGVRFTKIRTALPTMLHKLSELAGGANHVQRCSIEWCFLLFMTSLSDCSF